MTIPGAVWWFVAPPASVSLPFPGAIPAASDSVLPVVVSLGIAGVGISDWFGDDEEDEESVGDVIDSAFEEAISGGRDPAGSDDPGDLGELAGDDEWDDFGDLDDGGLGDAGGTGPSDLESRVDELENEVASVSSTVSTVRSENEEISETVGEIEENVRKLLDVYEMVTQGVNPFVDEVEPESGDIGTFGLFDGEDEPTDGGDPPDGATSTDTEELFGGDADGSDGEPDDGFEFDDPGDTDGDVDGDGMTFEELKAEYEAGDADRADDREPGGTEPAAGDADETGIGPAADTAGGDPAAAEPADAAANGSGGKPYLISLPDGYGAEVLVMEWLEYLLGKSDVAETLQAIRYYQNVEWISAEVADDLRTILGGFDRGHGANAARTDGSGRSRLTIEHHETSLAYIDRLAGGGFRRRSFEMGGGDRGV